MDSVRRWEQTPRREHLSLIGQGQGKPEGTRDTGLPGVLALFALLQTQGLDQLDFSRPLAGGMEEA